MPTIESDIIAYIISSARYSYTAGYTSTGFMPHHVYMDDELRQLWLGAYASAEADSTCHAEREAGFAARTAAFEADPATRSV